jgi:hypothetical protein
MLEAMSYTQRDIESAICQNFGINQHELEAGRFKDAVSLRVLLLFTHVTPVKSEVGRIVKMSEGSVRYNIAKAEDLKLDRLFRQRIISIEKILENKTKQ